MAMLGWQWLCYKAKKPEANPVLLLSLFPLFLKLLLFFATRKPVVVGWWARLITVVVRFSSFCGGVVQYWGQSQREGGGVFPLELAYRGNIKKNQYSRLIPSANPVFLSVEPLQLSPNKKSGSV